MQRPNSTTNSERKDQVQAQPDLFRQWHPANLVGRWMQDSAAQITAVARVTRVANVQSVSGYSIKSGKQRLSFDTRALVLSAGS